MAKLTADSSNYQIENNIVTCYSKPHLIQLILGSLRVVIRNGVVELPSKWHDLYSSIIVFSSFLAAYYYGLFYYHRLFEYSKVMFYGCAMGVFTEFTLYITNLYVARCENTDLNVKIYYMFQKIDKILRITSENHYTGAQAWVVNTHMYLLCFIFPLGYGCHSWSLGDDPQHTLILVLALLALYIDLFLFDSMLYFIAVRIIIFNRMLKNHIQKYEAEEPKKKRFNLKVVLRLIPDFDRVDTSLEWKQWPECIQAILESYRIINKIFNFPVLMSAIVLVVWTIIVIAIMVLEIQNGIYPMLAAVMIGIWAAFTASLFLMHTIMTHWISREFKETKKLCVRVMYFCNDPYRKAASAVLRNIHNSDPKFIIYGWIELNIQLPFIVLEIIVKNVLVAVQTFVSR